jgi:hypothetical protein
MERAAFCNTGSEAVLAAIRVARTVTGKAKLATFAGHYHGIFDEVLVKGTGTGAERHPVPIAPGIPANKVQDVVVLEYGNMDSLEVIRKYADDLALVMVEPVRSRNLDLQPREFLHALRKLTLELGIPLLFDEMVTGFRSHPGGAQALFGVQADLATYGKVIAGSSDRRRRAARRSTSTRSTGMGHRRWLDAGSRYDPVRRDVCVILSPPPPRAPAGRWETGPELQATLNERTTRFVQDRTRTSRLQRADPPRTLCVGVHHHVHELPGILPLLFRHAYAGCLHLRRSSGVFTLAHSDADFATYAASSRRQWRRCRTGLFSEDRSGNRASLEIVLTENQQEIWIGPSSAMKGRVHQPVDKAPGTAALDVVAMRTALRGPRRPA